MPSEPKSPWGVELEPHQKRVLQRLKKSPGVLVYHGLGSGKTITSITGADEQGGDAVVVVPAALRENYKKEIEKVKPVSTSFDVKSYEGFTKDPNARGKTLIIDEGQRLKNSGSKRSQVVRQAAQYAKKRIVLTGTPIENHPEELAPVMNVVSGRSTLPLGRTFRDMYIKESPVYAGFVNKLLGVSDGVEYSIRNENKLRNQIKGLVDYQASSSSNFPDLQHHHVNLDMTPKQEEVYKFVMNKLPWHLRQKVKEGIPPSKKESEQLNAFMTASRIVSNNVQPYSEGMSHEEAFSHAPKMQAIVNKVKEDIAKDNKHKSLIYSNFLGAGVKPIATELDRHGVPYRLFTGGMSDKERRAAIEDFNADRTKALLISGAGAEGLDLKGTRSVHVLEPHWNKSRINQVIGRARRYKSHDHLPEDQRRVDVYHYRAKEPKKPGLAKKLSFGLFGSDVRDQSTDDYLNMLGDNKQKLIDQFNNVLQQEGTTKVAKCGAEALGKRQTAKPQTLGRLKGH
jgi:SNF2 family DNA or RNA helicase